MLHPILETAHIEHMITWSLHYSLLKFLLANVPIFRIDGLTWLLTQRKQTNGAVLAE
jgi:hypothetical protein